MIGQIFRDFFVFLAHLAQMGANGPGPIWAHMGQGPMGQRPMGPMGQGPYGPMALTRMGQAHVAMGQGHGPMGQGPFFYFNFCFSLSVVVWGGVYPLSFSFSAHVVRTRHPL